MASLIDPGDDRRVRLAMLLALAGCDQLFGLTRIPSSPDARQDSLSDTPQDTAPDAPADATADANVACPPGYVTVANSPTLYRVYMAAADWNNAEATCEVDHIPGSLRYTHLAVIGDAIERGNVRSFAGVDIWVGLSDRVATGQYRWVTDEIVADDAAIQAKVSPPWASGEPTGGSEHCVWVAALSYYADADCSPTGFAYVCECDSNPVNSAHF